MAVPASPSIALYTSLERAFDHFNTDLFESALPPCLISIRAGHRLHGYHHAQRFITPSGETLDELGMHPGYFAIQPIEEVLATLVHEMVHHWQQHFGRPTKSNPHNRQWADKMIALGLQPSHNGYPDGRQTGRSMSDYIMPDGPFLVSCRRLIASGFAMPWLDRHVPTNPRNITLRQEALKSMGVELDLSEAPAAALPEKIGNAPAIIEHVPAARAKRLRYACATCDAKAWAAEESELLCGHCMTPLEPACKG